jgi:RimJ/RimL family protein N-acetyltransferase
MEPKEILQALGQPMAQGDIRLEPMAEGHRVALKAACAEDLDIWAIYSVSWGPDGFDANFDRVTAAKYWRPFVIFSGDRLVGMSCFINFDAGRQVVEIGNTYYVPDMRGSGLNRVVKDLMIRRAFDSGIRRIEFRVDTRNQRSQAAMAKIGATREGVLRADRITWTGHVRDTALFSMLAGEWPPE